ncbi:MAG: MFS transporter [Hyphomicrobiales bacterium]|nr:MFS transporter [Hyphomicrobiales bacterium]MBV8440844.1 MFS transporter [Hyphomicrobiales bacterium]
MTSQATSSPGPSTPQPSRWGVFANVAFTVILIASSVSAVGAAMFDTASSWLMTSLNPNPLMVSAVQVATMAPMFLLTIPAGALADVVDPRRLLIAAQFGIVAVGIAFAATVSLHLETPPALLATTFLLGAAGALAAPAWQIVTLILVQKAQLPSAIAIDNAGYNVSRAIGPALGGFAISALSIKVPFWVYCVTGFVVLATLIWWRPPRRAPESLPAERLFSAMSVGVRYARNNRDLDATLIRAIAFFPFAAAYWALMPLIARTQMHNGAELYGLMMGLFGLGSIVGSLTIEALKARLGPDLSAALGTVGTMLALALFAVARRPEVALVASFIAGASWIVVMTTMFVSAQVALPDWVRGRGLAIFLSVYFGAMTLGSALWGEVASLSGVPFALTAATVGAALGMALTWGWKLETGATLDLAPSMRWSAPAFAQRLEDDQGPILLIVDYRIDPKDSADFLALMQEIGHERMRDGAYAWNVYHDPDDLGRFVETSHVHSLLELKYRAARVTKADALIEAHMAQFLKEPPRETYLIASNRYVHAWRMRKGARAGQPAPDRRGLPQ